MQFTALHYFSYLEQFLSRKNHHSHHSQYPSDLQSLKNITGDLILQFLTFGCSMITFANLFSFNFNTRESAFIWYPMLNFSGTPKLKYIYNISPLVFFITPTVIFFNCKDNKFVIELMSWLSVFFFPLVLVSHSGFVLAGFYKIPPIGKFKLFKYVPKIF